MRRTSARVSAPSGLASALGTALSSAAVEAAGATGGAVTGAVTGGAPRGVGGRARISPNLISASSTTLAGTLAIRAATSATPSSAASRARRSRAIASSTAACWPTASAMSAAATPASTAAASVSRALRACSVVYALTQRSSTARAHTRASSSCPSTDSESGPPCSSKGSICLLHEERWASTFVVMTAESFAWAFACASSMRLMMRFAWSAGEIAAVAGERIAFTASATLSLSISLHPDRILSSLGSTTVLSSAVTHCTSGWTALHELRTSELTSSGDIRPAQEALRN